uniref:Vitellogenin receptor n=1 Tax=Panagrolaimus sp. JU765 TaxID=591449 RepID=A0AC34R5K0_9BILA
MNQRQNIFGFFIFLFVYVASSPCDINGEAAVIRCASDMVMQQFGVWTHANKMADQPYVTLPMRQVEQLCAKYDDFKQCSQFVDDQCRTSMLTNLMSLWNFVCAEDFTKSVKSNRECLDMAEDDPVIQRCLLEASEEFEKSSMNVTLSIAQKREQRCKLANRQIGCYTTFDYFKMCIDTVELHHKLLSFVTLNVSDLASCDLPGFAEIKNKFKSVEREKIRGTCTAEGCVCNEGFKYDNVTKNCVDVDECAEGISLCSQKCLNVEGSYECQCDPRFFKLGEDNRTCARIDSTPVWLYFAHGQSIWNLSETGRDFQLVRMGLQKTAMIDVDVKEQKIYYADIGANVIERKNIDGAFPQPIQTYEVDGVEGIAVDWVGRNLYSARRSNIFVQTLEGKYRKTLYKEKLVMPRALVVNPAEGMIYGTDWSSSAFIFKAAMDGSSFKKIVTENIVWPNAIAVDQYSGRLYWADAFLDTIQSTDLEGNHRRTIVSDPDAVPHVFGMAIADDNLYWTDWTYRGILRANKHSGLNITVLAQTALLPYGIKVYHPSVQPPHKNPCESMACSQLCLLNPDAQTGQCACSDGFQLDADGKACHSNCTNQEIICGGSDPKCISKKYLCDGVNQCADQADESHCPPRICLPGQFQCHDNKKCLQALSLCDGTPNCEDESDEKYCENSKPDRF